MSPVSLAQGNFSKIRMDAKESYTGISMQISNNVRESLFNNNKIVKNSIADPSHFTYEEK